MAQNGSRVSSNCFLTSRHPCVRMLSPLVMCLLLAVEWAFLPIHRVSNTSLSLLSRLAVMLASWKHFADSDGIALNPTVKSFWTWCVVPGLSRARCCLASPYDKVVRHTQSGKCMQMRSAALRCRIEPTSWLPALNGPYP